MPIPEKSKLFNNKKLGKMKANNTNLFDDFH